MKSDSESRVSLMADLQFEFHPIIRNFPACVSHFAVLRTLFIEYRVRVVYVNQDPAAPHSRVRHLKQTARSRKRYVPDCGRICAVQYTENPIFFKYDSSY